jgi:hypothetical protein
MRILYLSCHDALEYDEVKLLMEIGCEVFSTGSLLFTSNLFRDNIKLNTNEDLKSEWFRIKSKSTNSANQEIKIPDSFLDKFDVIIVSFFQRWLELNRGSFKNRNVIFRTIGQNLASHEASLHQYKDFIKIIRYSPMERFIPYYAGEHEVIRFYKDEGEFNNWNGNDKSIINFSRDLNSRPEFCNFFTLRRIGADLGIKIFGNNNEIIQPFSYGKVSYSQLKQELRNNRVYLHTGTKPASYTLNFIEALMTGIPIVSIGRELSKFMNLDLYEVQHIIKCGYNGYISDDYDELKDYCSALLNNDILAKEISNNARKTAKELFGKQTVKKQWENLLGV